MVELKIEQQQPDKWLSLAVLVEAVRKVHGPKGKDTEIKAEDSRLTLVP